MHALTFALVEQCPFLDVGFPLPVGRFFRVAYVVTESRFLATDLTFSHCTPSLVYDCNGRNDTT